jgi:hypothetical protein
MMIHPFKQYRYLLVNILLLFSTSLLANAMPPQREFYEIKIYHLKDATQEATVDKYLQEAFIPALHKAGIGKVGVFKPIGNDTAADRRIYVLVPYRSMEQFLKMPALLVANPAHNAAGKDYLEAVYNAPPYLRIESILLQAFTGQPQLTLSTLTGNKAERVYELRSYEGPTEALYRNKVEMFNKGDEVGLFKRLGFNAVFYAEVLSGSRMPNLMYMTTFENKASRDEHWKTFSSDAQWKQLSTNPYYQHNVSGSTILFLNPTAYSDI